MNLWIYDFWNLPGTVALYFDQNRVPRYFSLLKKNILLHILLETMEIIMLYIFAFYSLAS